MYIVNTHLPRKGKYPCMAGLDSVVIKHSNISLFYCLVNLNSVKLETIRTLILPLTKKFYGLYIFLSLTHDCVA